MQAPARDNGDYVIHRFLTRTEGDFLHIERWTRKDSGETHWRVISPEGITRLYGRSADFALAIPMIAASLLLAA